MTDIATLYPGYTVLSVGQFSHKILIEVEAILQPITCPLCASKHIVGFGRRHQDIADTPIDDKSVFLRATVRRFKCSDCKKTFKETLPMVDSKRSMTRRLIDWINAQAANQSFTSIARKVGLSENNIRLVFNDHVKVHNRTKVSALTCMVINKIDLVNPRLVITDPTHDVITDVLIDQDKKIFDRYMKDSVNIVDLKYVIMGPWPQYRDVLIGSASTCTIIIDPVYMIEIMSSGMEKYRQYFRANLTPQQKRHLAFDHVILSKRDKELSEHEKITLAKWGTRFPSLVQLYRVKEAFFEIFEADDRNDANKRFSDWRNSLTESLMIELSTLLRTWSEWESNILAYFDHASIRDLCEKNTAIIGRVGKVHRSHSFNAIKQKVMQA